MQADPPKDLVVSRVAGVESFDGVPRALVGRLDGVSRNGRPALTRGTALLSFFEAVSTVTRVSWL
jgi:hypothetical protein